MSIPSLRLMTTKPSLPRFASQRHNQTAQERIQPYLNVINNDGIVPYPSALQNADTGMAMVQEEFMREGRPDQAMTVLALRAQHLIQRPMVASHTQTTVENPRF